MEDTAADEGKADDAQQPRVLQFLDSLENCWLVNGDDLVDCHWHDNIHRVDTKGIGH